MVFFSPNTTKVVDRHYNYFLNIMLRVPWYFLRVPYIYFIVEDQDVHDILL